MSKKETWRTRLYWQIMGGFLIEEFHATELDSAAGISRRLIDGVIIDAKEIGSQVGGTVIPPLVTEFFSRGLRRHH